MYAPLLRSPFWGDDEPNSMRAAVLQFTNERPIAHIWRMANAWRIAEGRFFPVSAFENAYIFLWFHSRVPYKTLQVLIVLVVAIAVGLLVRAAGLGRISAQLGAVTVLTVIQIQLWFDSTMGFGLLLQSLTLKLLVVASLSFVLCTSTGVATTVSLWVLSTSIWTLAVFQYEVVIFVWPALVVAVLLYPTNWRRRLLALSSSTIPTIAGVITAVILRAHVITSEGYTISLFTKGFWKAFAQQIVAAIPLSSTVLLHQKGWSTRAWPVFLIATTTLLLLLLPMREHWSRPRPRAVLSLLSFGIGLLVLPAVPVAISLKWQTQLSWGHGYLAVFIQYVGVAIILATALASLQGFMEKKSRVIRTLCAVLAAAVLGGVAGAHAAGIESVVNAVEPITWKRELFEEAVRDGFFNEIPSGASIISSSYNPNGWFNPWYYQWLGGYRSHRLSGTTNGMVVSCTEAQKEGRCSLTGRWWGFAELLRGERETVDALGLYTMLDVDPLTTKMVPGSIKLIAHKYEQLPLECRAKLERTASGNWVGSCIERVETLGEVAELLKNGN